MKNVLIVAATCALLAACETAPRHYSEYGPPPGDTAVETHPYSQQSLPPPRVLSPTSVQPLATPGTRETVSALAKNGSSEPSKEIEGLISEGETKELQLRFDPAPDAQLSVVDIKK